MTNKNYSNVPVFENGMAQPVFPFTDGKTGEKYNPNTSSIVRYCVYVESDYDMDGDGKRDLVKVLVQVPRSAVEGNYKAASLFEARPYCAGVQEDGYAHMKEVESKEYRKFDFADLNKKVPARVPTDYISAMDLALKADPADWYYPDKGNNNNMVYENLEKCVYLFPYTLKLIQFFRKNGYRILFLSNYSEYLYEKTKGTLSFIETFDGGVFSFEETCIKPDKLIYERLLEKYHIAPEEALFFDDREENVRAAEELGIHGILFTSETADKILKGQIV